MDKICSAELCLSGVPIRLEYSPTAGYKANIQLKDNYVAKWIPSRPVPYNLQKHMEKEVQTLIDSGQIEKCSTPSLWNSPIFLVKKPGTNDSYRLIQDLRQLNANCLPDQFALPNVNSIMDNMTECNWLTSMDFTKGFNQIRLDEESRPLTAFSPVSRFFFHAWNFHFRGSFCCRNYTVCCIPVRLEYSLEYSPTAVPCSPCKIGIFPGLFPLKSLQFTVMNILEISLLQCCRDGTSLENSISAVAAALQQALQRWKIPGKFHCCSTAALQQ
eukprot:sb/3468124/